MMTFPPAPTDQVDWNNVGFQVRNCNGHISTTWIAETGAWSTPKFVKSPYIPLHGLSPALNYGQQAYEGLKAFRAPDETITVFRPNKNAVRLQHSACTLSMPEVPESLFVECVLKAVANNAEWVPPHKSGAAMYIRPLLFGSGEILALQPTKEYTFVVFVMPTGVYHGVHPVKALVLQDFDRAAPLGVGNAKVGGNYAPVLRHSDQAREAGYGITLHLDSKTNTEIDEFSTSGFIGVREDNGVTTVVVPDSTAVIDSVTSDSVQELARLRGWKVEKRPIKFDEVKEFKEVMAAGTAAALVPIRSITKGQETITFLDPEVNDAGPYCLRFLKQLQGIQFSKEEDVLGWNVKVEVKHTEVTHEP